MITVKTFVEGPIDANNYLVIDEESKDAVLIDCSSARPEFVQAVKDSGVNLKRILLTHGHFDHLMGVEGFKDSLGVDAFISEDDMSQVKLVPDMLQMFLGMMGGSIPSITGYIKDGDTILLNLGISKSREDLLFRVKAHDVSKYGDDEFEAYRNYFYPKEGEKKDRKAFDIAWKHHYTHNSHHWEFYLDEDGNHHEIIKAFES